MEIGYKTFIVDLFKAIFGGYVCYDSSSDKYVKINGSPILMSGFILGIIGLIAVIALIFCYKNKILNSKGLTIFAVTTFCLLLTAGILFIFKDTAIKTQFAQTMREMEPEITEEQLSAALKLVHISTDPGTLVFMIGQFFAAACVGGAYAVDRLVK